MRERKVPSRKYEQIQDYHPRRHFLHFAGLSTFFAWMQLFVSRSAHAQTWKKISNPSGSAGTWQKLTVASTLQSLRMTSVASGGAHSKALRTDGVIFASGENGFGNLANNTTFGKSTFAQCIGVTNVTSIEIGNYHYVALRSDGRIWGRL